MPAPTFLRDLASDVLNGRVSATSAVLALRLVERAEALEVGAAKEEAAAKVAAGSMGQLVWYGRADNFWLSREGYKERGDAYFTYFMGEMFYYQGGGAYVSDKRTVEAEKGPVVTRDWAVGLGFTVDPCPFLEPEKAEEPAVEPAGSDLDQLFAALKAFQETPEGNTYSYPKIVLYADESGGLMRSYDAKELLDWSTIKEGVAKIKALIDNS